MAAMTTRRKLAIATWSAPREGNIYGKLTLDATAAMAWLDDVRARTGEKVTLTHFVGCAVGEALKQVPSLNGRIVLGRYEPYPTVDVAFLIAMEDGSDLAKVKVENIDQKSVTALAQELRERTTRIRKGQDSEFEKSKGPIKLLPTWLIRPMLWFIGLLTGSFGVELKAFGLERFPFGSCIITSVGMFGLDEGFVPPTPFARVPVYVLIGAVKDAPAVVDGQLTIRKQVTLTATIDHRYIDGFQGGILAKVIRQIFENPQMLASRGTPAA